MVTSWIFSVILLNLVFLVSLSLCDVYLHNPRGSNNRLDENRRERNNANRLFDSQNNNRGGYNVGSVYYYTGSKVPIEWTNQHSCNNPNSNCEIILQYMCSDTLRDGASTATIPDNPANCENYNCDTDREFGMHEDFMYYLRCKLRERNQGLFTADQNLRRDTARSTRQNPNGARRGYECPEERDYYPYWGPTPWRDIAIFTNDPTRCEYYQEESQNVKSRFECDFADDVLIATRRERNMEIPITEAECEAFTITLPNGTSYTGRWVERPAHGIDAPECFQSLFTRDNHNGNTLGGIPFTYNWTAPADLDEEFCAMRIRYNISTGDYEGWDDVDASQNAPNNNQPANLDVYSRLGLTEQQAEDRGFVFENNPNVDMFENLNRVTLQLAINTAQYGRTFQDRSHRFSIRPAPSSLDEGAVIHNLNVRGKRGNIVQVYPAVEYDFVPNTLELPPGDYVHFQWTGSNTNPRNNDGQGLAGTDRSNVVQLTPPAFTEGGTLEYYRGYDKIGQFGRTYPEHTLNSSFLGFSTQNLMNLAVLMPNQFGGEMSELDDAGTYYDLGAQQVTSTGVYHYLCTRNNNFSNRDQKGRIIVRDAVILESFIGFTGGQLTSQDGGLSLDVPQGALTQPTPIRLEEWTKESQADALESQGLSVDNIRSSMVFVTPQDVMVEDGNVVTLQMRIEGSRSLEDVTFYRAPNPSSLSEGEVVEGEMDGEMATLRVRRGGLYFASANRKAGAIAGIVIGVLLVVAVIVGIVVYKLRKGKSDDSTASATGGGGMLSKIKRNFQDKV